METREATQATKSLDPYKIPTLIKIVLEEATNPLSESMGSPELLKAFAKRTKHMEAVEVRGWWLLDENDTDWMLWNKDPGRSDHHRPMAFWIPGNCVR